MIGKIDNAWVDARQALPDHSAIVAVLIVGPDPIVSVKMAWYGMRSNTWNYVSEFDAGYKVMYWCELPEAIAETEDDND